VASVGSTALHAFLLTIMDKTPAFLVTLYSFALFNYFVIGYIVKRSDQAAAAAKVKAATATPRGGAAAAVVLLGNHQTNALACVSCLPTTARNRKPHNALLDSQTVDLQPPLLTSTPAS